MGRGEGGGKGGRLALETGSAGNRVACFAGTVISGVATIQTV
jgi:hypothetical protein